MEINTNSIWVKYDLLLFFWRGGGWGKIHQISVLTFLMVKVFLLKLFVFVMTNPVSNRKISLIKLRALCTKTLLRKVIFAPPPNTKNEIPNFRLFTKKY